MHVFICLGGSYREVGALPPLPWSSCCLGQALRRQPCCGTLCRCVVVVVVVVVVMVAVVGIFSMLALRIFSRAVGNCAGVGEVEWDTMQMCTEVEDNCRLRKVAAFRLIKPNLYQDQTQPLSALLMCEVAAVSQWVC